MEEIKSDIINGKRYFLFISLYITLGTLLSMFFAWQLHVFFIVWIGIFIFWICPVLFQNQFRKGFTQNASFNFSDDTLQVEISNRITDELERTDKINYGDVDCFRAIDSSKDDSSFLRINLRNGDSFVYTILGQRKLKTKTNITDVVFKCFNNYNDLREGKDDKISLLPNLFATKTGYNLIVCLSILLLVSLVFQITYLPKSIPATLFTGLSFYLIILAQRKKDIEQSKKMR